MALRWNCYCEFHPKPEGLLRSHLRQMSEFEHREAAKRSMILLRHKLLRLLHYLRERQIKDFVKIQNKKHQV